MASDLSSGCTEVIEIFDEKEEGEISLEDVSSSEEGQLNDACNSRRRAAGQCPSCLSTKHCASWCRLTPRRSHSKSSMKKDAVQEKENCHHTKDSGYSGSKHPASTLQENNNDLIPISSDSDMEIVGLADVVKPPLVLPQAKTTKVRKRRRKKRPQNTSDAVENTAVLQPPNITAPECSLGAKRDSLILKDNHLPRGNHRRESNSPHKPSTSPFTRSRISKSPLRRHRSPLGTPRSPVLRKSPVRRPRSPGWRSPPLSPIRSPTRRQSRNSPSPSNTVIDMYGNVTKLLKKVRHLKTIGTHSANRNSGRRRGRGPSLKDKLNNMMKSSEASDNPSNETTGTSNSGKKFNEDFDDEEDLARLRQMALETKPKRSENLSEQSLEVRKETQGGNNNIGDDDVEDLELRMIALRSAMLKKHKDRMQRGVLPAKTKKLTIAPRSNTESPFSQSFLDGISIPGEDNKEEFKTPSEVLNENTNPEDMELDSEVEMEKEKGSEPYSPTDEISRQINIVDSELLGIQPSDVSFITSSSQALSNTKNFQSPQSERFEILETRASYLPITAPLDNHNLIYSPESPYYSTANVLLNSQSPASSLYSPVDATESLGNNVSTLSDDNLNATPYSPSQPIETPQIYFSPQDDPFFGSNPTTIPDTPYSPTDTPLYDLDVNNTPSLLNPPPSKETDTVSKAPDFGINTKRRKIKPQRALINIKLLSNFPTDIDGNEPSDNNLALTSEVSSSIYPEVKVALEKDAASETSSMKPDVGSACNSPENSIDETMIAVDELPETDLDGSPLVPMSREIRDIEIHIPATITEEIIKMAQEPLYLQGVPDVTKDANKIPTLVNRSLVPASILKSNKNLQQRLPPKKTEPHLEPTFKSAEMQPVQISNETNKTNRLFKPIKLAPVIKKPQLRMVTPAAFNCSSNDNSFQEENGGHGNVKSAQGTSKTEAASLSVDLQNEHTIQAARETREAINMPLSENSSKFVQSGKTLPLPVLEQRTNVVEDRGGNNDAFKVSSRISTENLGANSSKVKKPRRRKRPVRNRSKQDVKNTESKETPTSKGAACTNASSIRKQTPNSNKTNKNHSPGEVSQKTRSSRDKVKNSTPDKSKRDRRERRDRRSVHKYDKVSNSYKKTDANKPDNRRNSIKQQTETLKGTEHTSRSSSMDVENLKDTSTGKQPEVALNIHNHTANDRRSKSNSPSVNSIGRKSSELNKTEANIPKASASSENEAKSIDNSASNICTEDGEDSASNNTACKKVEANKRRRSSFDDDEETLRAILLASLAKRNKPSDPENTPPQTSTLANLSHTLENTSTESVKSLPNTPGARVSVNLVYSSSSDTTPPALGNNSLTTGDSSDKNSNTADSTQGKIPDTVTAESIAPKIVPSITPSRKRSISASTKVTLKKIAKKTPISASTKVVNNAKKYQNTLVQKKLNLQKVAMITNAQQALNRTNLHTNKVMDTGRTRSMITQPLSDTQRFVINLASDSESENETEIPSKNLDEPTNSNNKSEQKPVLAIPMSEFEKSVDLFLKDVRKKQETAAAVKPSSKTTQKPASPVVTPVHRKSPVLSTTPLAVRHLPVSLQEEYRRLKQQILEREKLKLHRVLVNNTSPLSPSSKSSGTPPGPLSPASPIASPTTSKQTYINPTGSQLATYTAAKDSSLRNVSVQSGVKNLVSSTTTMRVNPVVSKSNSPVSTLSIQIPNETTNANLAFKKSTNPYIPVNSSQTRLVTAVKKTQDIVNAKDSKDPVVVSVQDQMSMKNVQVQLQQGKTGRRVSLGETIHLNTKTAGAKNKEVQEPPATKASTNADINRTDKNVPKSVSSTTSLPDSRKTIDSVVVSEKCDNTVDSSASTVIISRENDNTENSTLSDSSESTVIITRNENADSFRNDKSASVENTKLESSVTKASTSGPKKLRNNTETWEKIRGDVRKELDAISVLPSSEQKSYLATAEQNLVKKRYAVLDDLSEISGNLRQLEMEKEVQSNMASEVKKLQEQLKLAEERLKAQRSRVNKMMPNITATYEKFNSGRRECVKMTRICLGLGCLVIGANYKIPAAGAQLLNNRLKQVAGSTRQLSSKKMSVTENTEESQSKILLPSQTSSMENCLDSPGSDSAQSSLQGNDAQRDDVSATISSEVVAEKTTDSNIKFAQTVGKGGTDTAEQERNTINFTESVCMDSPQLITSTPNSSKESSSGIKDVEYPQASTSTFGLLLENPEAGSSGKEKKNLDQRRFLQPYKSVLTHLTVPRTTDPSGILCPYELMGTCRDEDCQFIHQAARNG